MAVGICSFLDAIYFNIHINIYSVSLSFYKSFILMKRLRLKVLEYTYANVEISNNLLQLFDQIYMQALNITPEELDILVEKMSEEELELWSDLIYKPLSFSDRRKIIKFRNKHINYFYEKSI
jgi:hypothetical protein